MKIGRKCSSAFNGAEKDLKEVARYHWQQSYRGARISKQLLGSLEQATSLGTTSVSTYGTKRTRNFSVFRKLNKHKLMIFNFAIAVVLAVVGFGGVALTESSVPRGIGGTTIDEFSSMEIAASLAVDGDMLVADYIVPHTEEITSQQILATTGDNYLSKPAVIKTNGFASREIVSYIVQEGDSLDSLAQKFNVTSDTIRWANGLSKYSTALRVGQAITIAPVNGVVYTVKNGDTVEALAGKYDANVAQIIAFNDAELDGLQTGAQIVIPEGRIDESNVRVAGHYESDFDTFCGNVGDTSLGRVSRGQPIGVMGNTGYSFGTHLHFGMCNELGGVRVDPIASNATDCPRRPSGVEASGCELRYGFGWPTETKQHQLTRGFWSYSSYYAHRGVDIAGQGTIYAVADGEIIAAGWMAGGGYSVVILHDNGVVTHYMHMSSLAVRGN